MALPSRTLWPTLRTLSSAALAVSMALAASDRCGAASKPAKPGVDIVEATIPDLQRALTEGRTTSRQLVALYLERIATYEDRLNAVVTINPAAFAEADRLDEERLAGKLRGPLHGIPIALKDNIQTRDLATSVGALALQGFVPPEDATLVTNLREAGAIVLAKTGLTELANWIATGMPTNYNAVTGYGFNPYDARRDPREATADGRPALATGGSSSGVGTAASFWAANVGTETSGSILSPATQSLLAAVKPTVGRVSRRGIAPITADQDTAGPMARSVTDAAILLGALEGRAADPADEATTRCPREGDYTRFLDRKALAGARIGVPRAFFVEPTMPPGSKEKRGGLSPSQKAVFEEALGVLRAQGAVLVDPADVPSVVATEVADNFISWPVCSGYDNAKGKDADCSIVFKYGMKRDFNAWLGGLGPKAPVKTLTELRLWNVAHQKMGAIKYGQALLDISDEMDVAADAARYRLDRAKDLRLSAEQGLDAVIARHRLDAVVFLGGTGAGIAAKPGYPTVIVPAGFVANAPETAPTPGVAFPEGFEARPSPAGLSFTGLACSEPRLLGLAYAFEQATHRRVAPAL
jgi:amidase